MQLSSLSLSVSLFPFHFAFNVNFHMQELISIQVLFDFTIACYATSTLMTLSSPFSNCSSLPAASNQIKLEFDPAHWVLIEIDLLLISMFPHGVNEPL